MTVRRKGKSPVERVVYSMQFLRKGIVNSVRLGVIFGYPMAEDCWWESTVVQVAESGLYIEGEYSD